MCNSQHFLRPAKKSLHPTVQLLVQCFQEEKNPSRFFYLLVDLEPNNRTKENKLEKENEARMYCLGKSLQEKIFVKVTHENDCSK